MFILSRCAVLGSILLLTSLAYGDDEPPARKEKPEAVQKSAKAEAKPAKKKSADAEHEDAALLLVREHHPDLVELLKRLKGTKEKEYQQAIKELYRESERLEAARQRDPERYKLELRAWQLDSRMRLLTAKLSLEDRAELQEDLKAALGERADVRLAQKKLERERLTARVQKLDDEIANFASQRDADLKRNFDRLLRTAEKARPKRNKEKPGDREKKGDRETEGQRD